MHTLLTVAGLVLQALIVISLLLYAPFARDLRRAIEVPVLIGLIWAALRLVTLINFREPSPPLIGLVLTPVLCGVSAFLVRAGVPLLLSIPIVWRMAQKLMKAIGRK